MIETSYKTVVYGTSFIVLVLSIGIHNLVRNLRDRHLKDEDEDVVEEGFDPKMLNTPVDSDAEQDEEEGGDDSGSSGGRPRGGGRGGRGGGQVSSGGEGGGRGKKGKRKKGGGGGGDSGGDSEDS